jgi:hypothetical protein
MKLPANSPTPNRMSTHGTEAAARPLTSISVYAM